MISQHAFDEAFAHLAEKLEMRRRRYLWYFRIGVVIAALLTVGCFAAGDVMRILHWIVHSEGPVTVTETSLLISYLVTFSLLLVFMPVFLYRGKNRSAALKPFKSHRYSLKDEAYSALVRLFGPFEFAPRGGVSPADTRGSLLLAGHPACFPEDYLCGSMNDIAVRLCEASFVRVEHGRRYAIFKGILLVCDLIQRDVGLREPFLGHGVVTPAREGVGYPGETFALPEPVAATHRCYTTGTDEANLLLTPNLLDALNTLSAKAMVLKEQATHWDDRIAHALAELATRYRDLREAIFARPPLPSEREYDAEFKARPDLTKADPLCERSPLNHGFSMEYYDSKCLVMIPCGGDLFETNSLFAPALNTEDAVFLYALMQTVDTITRHLSAVAAERNRQHG